MAINFTTLFTHLGHIAQIVADTDSFISSTLPTDIQTVIGDYAPADEVIYDGINQQLVSAQQAPESLSQYCVTLSSNLINRTVFLDNPLSSDTDIELSLEEVIRQMKAQSQTVQQYTLTATVDNSTVTNGNGVLVVSTVDSTGLQLQNMFAEKIRVNVTTDSTSSTNIAGNERFQALGEVSEPDVFAADWPLGSGGRVSLSAINPTQNNTQGNLLTNSDYENWTASVPNNWTVNAGASRISKSVAQHYTGSASMQWAGDSSTHTEIVQPFASSTGTTGTLSNETVYQFAIWLRVDVVPAAGVVEIALVDGNDTVVNDAQGNAQAVTQSLTGFTAGTWTVFTGSLRTPYEMPTEIQLRLRLSTALSTGTNLFIDHLGLGAASQLYSGGPWLSVFSGSSNYFVPDFFTITTTNSRPSNKKSFQEYFDRVFGMRTMDLILPYANSPTQADSLI